MALLFRPRGPREYQHKPIYWNPEKEALNKRIEAIQEELKQEGKLSQEVSPTSLYSAHAQAQEVQDTPIKNLIKGTDSVSSREDEIHAAFLQNMRHLSKQERKGISGNTRVKVIIRSLLFLLLLFLIAWYLYVPR